MNDEIADNPVKVGMRGEGAHRLATPTASAHMWHYCGHISITHIAEPSLESRSKQVYIDASVLTPTEIDVFITGTFC